MSHSHPSDYYDGFAPTYDAPRGEGYHAMIDDLETEIVIPFATGRDCLELGCGTGLILERIAKVARRAEGIDISPGMLAKAKDRGLSVQLGGVDALPYADASFDLVYSFKVLAHVEAIGKALAEAARVTRPGGHMVLEFYNPLSLRYLAKRAVGPGKIGASHTEADMYTRWDPPWVIERLLPAGVQLQHFRGVRVLTPAAFAHRVPLAGAALRKLERAAVASPLRYFGGFLVAVLAKTE